MTTGEPERMPTDDRPAPSRLGRAALLAYLLVFAILCVVPLAGLALGYENPNLEKRALSPMPEFVQDGQPNLDVMKGFDAYLADHFAFRTRLVSGWHALNQSLLGQSGSTKVIAGKSGWLFYADTLADHLASAPLDDAELRRLARTLALQQEHLAGLGIGFYFTVAPNKNSVYGQFMPDRFTPVGSVGSLGKWMASPYSREVATIDLLTPLRQAAARSDLPVYHQTDSHWNNLGALVGYQALMSAVSGQTTRFTYADHRQAVFATRADWTGDLAAMLSPSGVKPDLQQYFDLPQRYRTLRPLRSYEDMLIQTTLPAGSGATSSGTAAGGTASGVASAGASPGEAGGAGPSEAAAGPAGPAVTTDARSLKLWMFRDSFANALVPFLANAFGAATFTREVPYNYTALDKGKADIVILEIVERNLPQLLQRAPVLPAPQRSRPEPLVNGSGSPGAPQVDRLLAGLGNRWLKLAGRLRGGQAGLDAIGRIYLGVKDENGTVRYQEATPIDETAGMGAEAVAGQAAEAAAGQAGGYAGGTAAGIPGREAIGLGFTAFLPAGRWQPGSQSVEVWFEQPDGWQRQEMIITLP